MTSEIDIDCLAGVDGLSTVTNVHDNEAESQDVPMIKPVRCVIAAIPVWRVPIEARMQSE